MRTIIEVPPAQLDELDRLCKREGISRAEAIRQAMWNTFYNLLKI